MYIQNMGRHSEKSCGKSEQIHNCQNKKPEKEQRELSKTTTAGRAEVLREVSLEKLNPSLVTEDKCC